MSWREREKAEFIELFNLQNAVIKHCLHCGKPIYYGSDRMFYCAEDCLTEINIHIVRHHGTQYWLHGFSLCLQQGLPATIYSCPRKEDI